MAESLGQYCRRAREEKGWTLEQAAAKTRILPHYLQAVEEDNYAGLPEEVFAKGFVRSYARMLGLDEADILQRFNESGGQFYAKRAEREQLKQQLREEERRKKVNQLIVAGTVGVALVALLLVSGQDREPHRSAVETPKEPALPPKSAAPTIIPSRPEPEARPEPPPVKQEEPAREPLPVPPLETERNFSSASPLDGIAPEHKKLVLDVEAVERVWVLVKADQHSAQEVMLSPGEHIRWSAEEKVTLTLGNAGGVRISVNGKPQGPYGGKGKVVKDLVFTR